MRPDLHKLVLIYVGWTSVQRGVCLYFMTPFITDSFVRMNSDLKKEDF